jgi:hypothetical protein
MKSFRGERGGDMNLTESCCLSMSLLKILKKFPGQAFLLMTNKQEPAITESKSIAKLSLKFFWLDEHSLEVVTSF